MTATTLFQLHTAHSPDDRWAHLVAQQIASWEMSIGDHRALCVDRPPPWPQH